jgi:Fe-Mn family superoxide dismutase
MTGINRRSALSMVGVGAAVAAMDGVAPVPATAQSPAPRRTHQPRPLPFSASRLDGLSERLITSHWQNNYVGSVNALNMVETRLAAAMADPDFSPLIYGDIKREQLHRTGSVVLHEIYFGNLGGDGRAGGDVQQALASAFGSLAAWEAEFRRTATALAGGSGWCLLALNVHTGDLQNYWMWDHMHAPATGHSPARARYVRARLSHGLRQRRRPLHRRIHAQRELGGGRPPLLPRAPGRFARVRAPASA